MARGTVKWFNSQKGYGFIQPQDGGKDVFVHISAVERAGLPGLNEGQTVEFESRQDLGGKSQGLALRPVRQNVTWPRPTTAGLLIPRSPSGPPR